jgi:cytochrome c-type biogenesis protein CcmF
MILHPPTLFIGYAGMTIPFAFAIAALVVNDGSKKWVELTDRITIFSWLFLGAGIGLGAVWAYVVLGWGGYWGWDPVENASLLPWLTGVGLLHSFTVYRKREGFKRWSVMMAAFTFALVILGTFITRSGILSDSSVHSFAPDNISLWLFLFMIVASITSAGIGLIMRWDTFSGNDEFESLTSKEAAYYFNNVIMLVAGLVVAYLTLTAAFPKWLPLGGQSIPATTFDSVARPVGILYLAILAVCPMLSWRGTDGAAFWKRLKWPLLATVVVFGLLMFEYVKNLRPIYYFMIQQSSLPGQKMLSGGPAWYYETMAVLGLFVASLLVCTTTSLFIDGAMKRAKARSEGFFAALWSIVTKARSQSGGYLSHLGMGIILIGLVGSAMFVMDQTFVVDNKPGSTFQIENYKFTYGGTSESTLANGNAVTKAKFTITSGGKTVSTIEPGQTAFPNSDKPRLDAAVLSQPLRDVFVVYQGQEQGGGLSINVKVNPLIWFSWFGFILLLIGTSLAAWPKRGARELAAVSTSGTRSGRAKASSKAKK